MYAAFGNKAAILAAAVDLAIVGYDDAVAVNDRDRMRTVLEEHDPEQRLRGYATAVARIQSGAARVFRVLDLAAGDAPELEALWRESMRRRRVGVTGVVGPIADAGGLRAGLDAATAIDIVWSLNGHEVFLNFVDQCGWPAAQYGEWLGDTLVELLLADGRGPATS